MYAPSAHNPSLQRANRCLLLLFSLVVAAYCLWVLSLPVFPSQDGPLHLYYAHIFQRILIGAPGVYAVYYRVGSWFPPYVLYYYLLIALGKLVALPTADKLVVSGSMALIAFGFRYLALSIGRQGGVTAFLVLPVLLSWPIAMGFLNFALGLGIAFWAAGVWGRFRLGHGSARRVLFISLVYVLMITHPVPLTMLILVCGLQFTVHTVTYLRTAQPRSREVYAALRQDAFCLLAALPAFLYIRRFTIRAVFAGGEAESLRRRLADNVFNYAHGVGLLVFTARDVVSTCFQVGLTLLFLCALISGAVYCWRTLRGGRLDSASGWVLIAIASAFVLPLIPSDLNGAHFFAWRLVLVVFLATALGTTGAAQGRWMAPTLVGASVFLSVCGLGLAMVRLTPVAQQISRVIAAPPLPAHSVGVLVQGGSNLGEAGLNYRPLLWAGADYFRRHDLVLYNSAWIDQPQMPIQRNAAMGHLEPTGTQRAPRLSDPPAAFTPGGEWNPPEVQFFFLERISSTPLESRPRDPWQQVVMPLGGVALQHCAEGEWFCLGTKQ